LFVYDDKSLDHHIPAKFSQIFAIVEHMSLRKKYVVPNYIYVMWFTLILAFGLGIFRQEWLTVFVSLMTLGISQYAISLTRRTNIRVPAPFLTATILFVYASLFLGEVGDFYERFWWWDVLLHAGSAIGFGLIGAVTLILLFRQGKVQASPILVSVFVFSFALAVGAVWEIFEFGMDQLFGLSMQKSGLVDTMADLIVDSIGGLLAAAASYAYLTKGSKTTFTAVLDEAIEENQNE
jgi:hypothetical protein